MCYSEGISHTVFLLKSLVIVGPDTYKHQHHCNCSDQIHNTWEGERGVIIILDNLNLFLLPIMMRCSNSASRTSVSTSESDTFAERFLTIFLISRDSSTASWHSGQDCSAYLVAEWECYGCWLSPMYYCLWCTTALAIPLCTSYRHCSQIPLNPLQQGVRAWTKYKPLLWRHQYSISSWRMECEGLATRI